MLKKEIRANQPEGGSVFGKKKKKKNSKQVQIKKEKNTWQTIVRQNV